MMILPNMMGTNVIFPISPHIQPPEDPPILAASSIWKVIKFMFSTIPTHQPDVKGHPGTIQPRLCLAMAVWCCVLTMKNMS